MQVVERMGVPLFIQAVAEISFEIVLVTIIFSMFFSMAQDKKHRFMKKITIPYTKEIFVFFIAIFFYNLSNLGIIFWEGLPGTFAGAVVRVSVFCYYLVGAFFTLFFLQVMKADVAVPLGMYRVRRLLTLFQFLQVPLLLLLFATPFSRALYYFDLKNHYCRSFGYLIWFYDTLAAFLVIGAVVICCYRRTDRFMKNVFVVGAAVPVTAFFLDFFIHNVSLNSISVMLAGLLIFLLYEKHKVAYAIESSRQLDRMQMKLMLSQIQPHFLHNTLTSILYYCLYERPLYRL